MNSQIFKIIVIILSVLFINCDPYTRSPTVCGFIGTEFVGLMSLFYIGIKAKLKRTI